MPRCSRCCSPRSPSSRPQLTDDDLTGVSVRTRNGRIVVVAGPLDVEFRIRSSFTDPQPTASVVDGILTVRDGCPDDRFLGSCQVDVLLSVPGDVPVEATTINGRIELADRAGPVTAASTNGELTLRGASAPTVGLTTINGTIDATFTAQPERVRAETTNGGVTLRLPGGPYDVVAETTNGPVDVEVATEAGAPRVEARSVNGPIVVTPAG